MPSNKKLLQAASGNAGDPLYVEDVFSTYLYTGNSSTQTINNGIDLAGEGGLVWHKRRTSTGENHYLYDTERGAAKSLRSNGTNAEDATGTGGLTSFNSNGYTYGTAQETGQDYVGWTFRKAEKFFDVVTYTGNGVAGRTVAHNLGSAPAMIIVKQVNGTESWNVYHESMGNNALIYLNYTDGKFQPNTNWNNTSPTSTEFTVSSSNAVNGSGNTYVAYLFASDAGGFGADGSESVVKCGSFTTGASGKMSSPVDCGFEPQWLLVKNSGGAENWNIYDTMRGLSVSLDALLHPNLNNAEDTGTKLTVTATGFDTPLANGPFSSGATYIYMAIRMSMKTPTAGTEVFSPVARTGTGTTAAVTGVGFSPDLFIGNIRDTAGYWNGVVDRLRGIPKRLVSSQTEAENTQTVITSFDMDGLSLTSDGNGFANENGKTYIEWLFKRATGFMDVVAYTGTGSTHTEAHNLGVAPELIIIKKRDTTRSWAIYSKSIPINQYLTMPSPTAAATFSLWNNTAPTSSVFSIETDGSVNASAGTYISYLFATVAGVSKVGSYTGTAATLNVDCGFTAGARFILIKRTDSAGDWYTYDSARGIVAGNDPYLLLNTTGAEVTNTDYIDPLNAGFTATSNGSSTVNVNGGTYIFLAIAQDYQL